MYWYWCSPVELSYVRRIVSLCPLPSISISMWWSLQFIFVRFLYVHLPYDNEIEWLNGTLYHCWSHFKEMTVTVNGIVASITPFFHLCLSYVSFSPFIQCLVYHSLFASKWHNMFEWMPFTDRYCFKSTFLFSFDDI